MTTYSSFDYWVSPYCILITSIVILFFSDTVSSGNKWKRFKKTLCPNFSCSCCPKNWLAHIFWGTVPPLPSPSFSAPYAYAFGVIILFLTSLQSVLDAQWLAYQVQMYYASEGDRREEILKTFNVFPEKFDHMTVVKELNSEIESGVLTGSVEDKE